FLPVSAGMDVILPHLKSLKERGYSIVVFPEGTRSADCSILRFHQGAFLLAQELEMDIVPMVLHGAGDYLPKKDFMFRKGKITLRILPRVASGTYSELALRQRASLFRKMIRNEYEGIADRKENAEYFRSLVLYKYAYRGWNTVSRCKSLLKASKRFDHLINESRNHKCVRIINSGIGAFALLYALVNKHTEVYAFENNSADHTIANATAYLPKNLHYIHAVWNSGLDMEENFDLTVILDSDSHERSSSDTIYLPLKS
ncbi:MAG: 1-acyl-sn-glycerol-3-phosphate acyltransferase, partial [Muribaculaceae bacterium]|nr:1-acyl-sn-glycerol-3-phosphate acyltransferase [Muribaculaceae bacterium]